MVPGDGPPLSLRPFPVADQKPKNLADFIARVNAQPGGFRSVTEDKLRDEIKASDSQNGFAQADDVDMSDTDEDDDNDGPATKDPNQARMEVLRHVEYDTIFLLLCMFRELAWQFNRESTSANMVFRK